MHSNSWTLGDEAHVVMMGGGVPIEIIDELI
jgi:hypothetical protein